MSAAIVGILVGALIAIVTLVLTGRRASLRDAAEKQRVDKLEAQLKEVREAGAAFKHRAEQAEGARGIAAKWVEASTKHAAEVEEKLAAAGSLWELERLRLEREWSEVTGTSDPLPVLWDGSVPAAIAVELELIREGMGVPSTVEATREWATMDPFTALAGIRLTSEVIRALARVGDEITVSFGNHGVVTMTLATHGVDPEPDLRRLNPAVASLGGELTLLPIVGGYRAHLRLPGLGSS